MQHTQVFVTTRYNTRMYCTHLRIVHIYCHITSHAIRCVRAPCSSLVTFQITLHAHFLRTAHYMLRMSSYILRICCWHDSKTWLKDMTQRHDSKTWLKDMTQCLLTSYAYVVQTTSSYIPVFLHSHTCFLHNVFLHLTHMLYRLPSRYISRHLLHLTHIFDIYLLHLTHISLTSHAISYIWRIYLTCITCVSAVKVLMKQGFSR
jgi:hypothetical protein